MTSIKDVARLAGVSIATVSRAVNNLDVVSDETRRRIQWAVDRLGYSPNLAARSLKRQSAKLLGLLVPDIENPFYATLAKHMEREASTAGYSLILCNTDGRSETEDHYLKLLSGRLSDGIFLCRSAIRASSLTASGGKTIPLVFLEKQEDGDDRQSVMVDNTDVGVLAARHLAEIGHARLACIMEDKRILPFARRVRGFIDETASHGIRVRPNSIIESGPRISDGRSAMLRLLKKRADSRPTAVYCTNDLLAFGAMQAVFETGLRIPEDISLVGTDDVAQSSYMYPPLTTVRQPFADIAREALRILIHKNVPAGGDVLLPPELVVRRSTGPAAGT
ncbi:MAG: LacI family transcriptional regulator [Planctomycetota bacterium]|jgi:LacI family transcriptional regulator|nr:LacI family transcriptional regulator [Planctomycetota bacterium]